jgi:pimeloyl-ACP methyl ester carboxylesterase
LALTQCQAASGERSGAWRVTDSPSTRTEFVHANGLTFEVQICGSGERLALCLHGFPEHPFSWRYQLPLLARLGYTAWAPCLRGYGHSSRPRRVVDYRLECLLGDVTGLIDAAGKQSTLLLGHDWGGAIAWMFALREICPLEGLVVLNIPHPAMFIQRLWRWPQILRSWYIFFFQLPWLPEFLLGRCGAQAVGDAIRNTAVDKSRFPDDVLEVYRASARQPGALTAMLNYYRAFMRWRLSVPDRRAITRILTVPNLMIWGEQDKALGKELTFGTERLVADFTLHYLPGASHWVQQEAPEQVNLLLESWLLAQDARSGRT